MSWKKVKSKENLILEKSEHLSRDWRVICNLLGLPEKTTDINLDIKKVSYFIDPDENKSMKNNTAKVNSTTMTLTLKFKGELFTIDLTQGLAEDNWNTITTSDDTKYAVNLFWDIQEMRRPVVKVYGLKSNKKDYLEINTKEQYNFKVCRGGFTKEEYFNNNRNT